jgi:hypothetical protein
LKEQPRINPETLRQCRDVFLVQAALAREHPRHHRLGANLGQIGGAEPVLSHQQTKQGKICRLLKCALLEGGLCLILLLVGFDSPAQQVDDGVERVFGRILCLLHEAFNQRQRLDILRVIPDREIGRRFLRETMAGFF